jgi:uncharacterized phage-associated protein
MFTPIFQQSGGYAPFPGLHNIQTANMKPIVSSTFDIAHWFLQRGELGRTFISPLKLQRLLYLSQAHYAGLHDGQPLMPSFFVVSEVGPLEPNIHRAIEHEPPKVSVRDIPEEIMEFVEMIWRKYGARQIDALNRLVMQDPAFKGAETLEGLQAVIGLDAMQRHYAPPDTAKALQNIPDKLPDEIPDFIADIISAARDEARDSESAVSSPADSGLKDFTPWIPGVAAENG